MEGPLVVQDCVEEGGAIFMNVGAEAPHMIAMFLGTKYQRKKRVKESYAVGPSLSDLRLYRNSVGRRKLHEILQGMTHVGDNNCPPAGHRGDSGLVLDFDDEQPSGDSQSSGDVPSASRGGTRCVSRRLIKVATKMLPSIVTIEVPMASGELWTPRVVLPKQPQRSVYMEFTDGNLSRLTAVLRREDEDAIEEPALKKPAPRDRKKKPKKDNDEDDGQGVL